MGLRKGRTAINSTPSQPLIYDTAGVYIIRLNVMGDGGENWDYRKVTVFPKPTADFSFEPDTVWVRSQNEDGTPVKFSIFQEWLILLLGFW